MDDLQEPLTRYRAGGNDALEGILECLRRKGASLLERHEHRLSPHDRDDILSRALEAMWNSLPRFRGDSAGELWVYFRVTLHRKVVDFWRSRPAVEALDEAPAGRSHGEDLVVAGPEQTVEEQDAQVRLHELLRTTLSRLEFEVALLMSEGFKYREIASILKIRTGTVGTAASRARAKLGRVFPDRVVKKVTPATRLTDSEDAQGAQDA